MKRIVKITGICALCALIFTAEATAASKKKKAKNAEEVTPTEAPAPEQKAPEKETKKLRKGEGIVLAVTQPQLRSAESEAAWMPQFFQDSLTGNLAKYSKMTVLDRTNEDLAKAEIRLSEESYYDEESTVELGHMTNARYVVFGTIQKLSSDYELNFRVNDIETNEIRAAFNNRYALRQIESGKAVCDIVQELFAGLEIDLTEKEKSALTVTDTVEIRGTASLAKGAVAEKSDNIMEALLYYTEAEESGVTKAEAGAGIKSVLGANTLSEAGIQNIKAQMAWGDAQVEKWNKIIDEMDKFISENLFIVVYDFSSMTTEMNFQSKNVKFKLSPGAKVVADRQVLLVVKKIKNEWQKACDEDTVIGWTKSVKKGSFKNYGMLGDYLNFNQKPGDINTIRYPSYTPYVSFYDYTGYKIKELNFRSSFPGLGNVSVENIPSQKVLFKDREFFDRYDLSLSISDLPDEGDVTVKIERVDANSLRVVKCRIMSIDEYNEWVKDK